MTEKSKKIISEEILNLPKEAQDAINSLDWVKMVAEIGGKYLLDEDEINILQLETASLLLGFIDEDSYSLDIENEVGTSRKEAEKISAEVFEKIFGPIAEALIENIKTSEKVKNPNWNQNLDFILSGGDYAAFAEQQNSPEEPLPGLPRNSGEEKSDDVKLKMVL